MSMASIVHVHPHPRRNLPDRQHPQHNVCWGCCLLRNERTVETHQRCVSTRAYAVDRYVADHAVDRYVADHAATLSQ
jgi:hypothetical protein